MVFLCFFEYQQENVLLLRHLDALRDEKPLDALVDADTKLGACKQLSPPPHAPSTKLPPPAAPRCGLARLGHGLPYNSLKDWSKDGRRHGGPMAPLEFMFLIIVFVLF